MPTTYNDPIMLDSTGQDIVDKLDSIASLMGDGVIDDTSTVATDKTWSINKISEVDNKLQNGVIANTQLIKDTVGWSGKNKLKNTSSSGTSLGITQNVHNDGVMDVYGTATETKFVTIGHSNRGLKLTEGHKYILSGCPAGGTSNTYKLDFRTEVGGQTTVLAEDIGNGVMFTMPTLPSGSEYQVILRIASGTNMGTQENPKVFYPMITDADIIDQSFEPYFGSTAFPRSEQAVLGAYNILPTGNVSHNDHGIVVSTDSNGIVTVTGTLASDAPVVYKTYISNYKLPVGRYKMVGCPPNGANNLQNQLLEVKNGSTVVNSYTDIGEGVEFEITDPSHTISVYVPRLGNGLRGQACNFVYKPMITTDLNATYDDFVPYAMTNRELTEKVNGMVDYVNTTANNGNAYTGSLDNAPLGYVYCSSGCTNNPVNKWGVTETIKASSTAKIQKFYSVETDDFCIRRMVSSAWQAWQKVTTTSVS